MIETKIVAYDYRCDLLYRYGIPYMTYWYNGVLYFSFYNDLNLREALDLFGV